MAKFTAKLAGMAKLAGKKISAKSPTILVVAGTVGLIAAGVIAAKKSATELNAVLDEHKADKQKLQDIRDGKVVLDEISTEEYAAKKYKKHLTALYIRTGKKLIKVYGPAIVLAILSVLSIFGGHKILTKRFFASVTECYAVRETLNEYRKRVAGKIGDEAEELLFLNAEKEVVTEDVKDPKTGEVKRESAEVLHGPETKGIYRYIVSRETVKPHAWYDYESRQCEFLDRTLMVVGNDYLNDHTFLFLKDLMQHVWKDEYICKHPEIVDAGWWRGNPYAEELPLINPVTIKIKKISAPGEESKYEVIFNCQGNIVQAMELANKEKREAKFRYKKRPQGKLRPSAA